MKIKINKHSYCKRENCPYIGRSGAIDEDLGLAYPEDKKNKEHKFMVILENGKFGFFNESDFERL